MKLLSTTFAMSLTLAAASNARAEHVWIFGDSLSDTGNLGLFFGGDGNPNTYLPTAYTPYDSPVPGLSLQRISSGEITMEYVADHYKSSALPSGLPAALQALVDAGLVDEATRDAIIEQNLGGDANRAANNFAVFGAFAGGQSPLDLRFQVAQLAQRMGSVHPDEDRAIVAIGSNDVYGAWGAALAPLQSGGEIDLAAGEALLDAALAEYEDLVFGAGSTIPNADGTRTSIPSIAALGLSHLTIMNSPDIAATPWVNQTADFTGFQTAAAVSQYYPAEQAQAMGAAAAAGVRNAAAHMTEYFNTGLRALVESYAAPTKASCDDDAPYVEFLSDCDLEVFYVDLDRIVDDIIAEEAAIDAAAGDDAAGDFVNSKDDCFLTNTLATLQSGTAPTPAVYRDGCSADEASKWMFLDTSHPTEGLHAKVGHKVVRALKQAERQARRRNNPFWFWF